MDSKNLEALTSCKCMHADTSLTFQTLFQPPFCMMLAAGSGSGSFPMHAGSIYTHTVQKV